MSSITNQMVARKADIMKKYILRFYVHDACGNFSSSFNKVGFTNSILKSV